MQSDYETGKAPQAQVCMVSKDEQEHTASANGDGPVDCIFNAVDKITGMTCKLLDYQVMSKTKGKDAQGEVTVRVSSGKRVVIGKGFGVNTLEASALAYINAINKLLIKTKSGPVEGSEIPGP